MPPVTEAMTCPDHPAEIQQLGRVQEAEQTFALHRQVLREEEQRLDRRFEQIQTFVFALRK